MRKILHIDMDAFYASIEMRDNPHLRHVPLVIGRNPKHTGGKGVVATANYVARKYGIHSAMSTQEALERCPNAVFKQPDFQKYRRISNQIHDIFHEYTDQAEYVALDEAYLDVTTNKPEIESAVQVAVEIRRKIKQQTRLNCSLGISYNKFLAKLASDYCKPYGNTVIYPEDAIAFLTRLPIEKFRGVGKKTVPLMHQLGINKGADLLSWSEVDLANKFGKFGYVLYERARGIDHRPVEWQQERKSIGSERTFDQPLNSQEQVNRELLWSAERLVKTLQKKGLHGKTLVVKVRDSDYETTTKRATFSDYLANDPKVFLNEGRKLFEDVQLDNIDVRLLGLTITNLAPVGFQDLALNLEI